MKFDTLNEQYRNGWLPKEVKMTRREYAEFLRSCRESKDCIAIGDSSLPVSSVFGHPLVIIDEVSQ